jgi:ribosomal protein S18 acetylase RimI-like enzyme
VDAWRATYRGIVSDDVLDRLSYERREEMWRGILGRAAAERTVMFVAATQTGDVVGFVSAGPETTGDSAYTGEIYAIYLLEQHQRRGLGRRLMRAAAEGLAEGGAGAVLLWVLADNPPARRFYESLGGRVVKERPIEIGGSTLREVAYAWDDAARLIAACGAPA